MGRKLAGSVGLDGGDEDDEEETSKDGGGGGNKKNKNKGKNDGKGGNSANETARAEEKSKDGRNGKKGGKDDRAKKSRKRLLYVIAFMGGLNAFSFLLILTFFIWYKKSAKKGGLGQTVGETGKDTDDTGGGATPAVTPQGEAPAASSSTPSKGPTDAGAPSGPDAAPPPPPQQGGAAAPPGQDGAAPHPQGAGEMLENGYFVSEQVTI
ncbi:hypothetical protein OESDEN_12081 [Oesophagostomum dentatum]|uniref:Uncharacterized protein n=1 Tax=Oesophagostomum dentatum TaxID=61180 RepID=A0A0B1ST91_OESDE|nr:hypothetical protein OESDEN_12081 [Oesophagostomum dentatum]